MGAGRRAGPATRRRNYSCIASLLWQSKRGPDTIRNRIPRHYLSIGNRRSLLGDAGARCRHNTDHGLRVNDRGLLACVLEFIESLVNVEARDRNA